MLGNAQRRDTAKELRRAAMGAYRHVDALDIIAGAVGVDISGMCTHEAEEAVYAVLADLIDRPTCKNLGLEEGTNGEDYDFFCSRCGFAADVVDPRYCPCCGAEVAE